MDAAATPCRLWPALVLALLVTACDSRPAPPRPSAPPASAPSKPAPPWQATVPAGKKAVAQAEAKGSYIDWLRERSMLTPRPAIRQAIRDTESATRHAFARARPEDFIRLASVWLTAYPDSMLVNPGQSVLDVMGSPELLDALRAVGIQGMHTGPVKLSGSVDGRVYKPSIDGNFDRIQMEITPAYGNRAQYRAMVANAQGRDIDIIGDLIPGHTGLGPDFRLMERAVPGWDGLYVTASIKAEDWDLLPPVPQGQTTVNLGEKTVRKLAQRGYQVGNFDTVIFARPGFKTTNWSATDEVKGVDGITRRWVYLHFFKRGQPTLNWYHPSFAAQRLEANDMLDSLKVLGTGALRLDATAFLGPEPSPANPADWTISPVLARAATESLAMLIRKYGGYSFQELNIGLDELKDTMERGPDLSYDFTTRPAVMYALATGDAGPLRLVLHQMAAKGVRPMRMVHALQNHDELMLVSTEFLACARETFTVDGRETTGQALADLLSTKPLEVTTGPSTPYNVSFAMSAGVCSTLGGFIAARLGVTELEAITREQAVALRNLHLADAVFNATLPGVFALSGWDMVGAMPLPAAEMASFLEDNDARWLNRGAYDLAGTAGPDARSVAGLPVALALYGPIPEQLTDPHSFASRLRELLAVRAGCGLDLGRFIAAPPTKNPGVVATVTELPEGGGLVVAAVNFGETPAGEVLATDPADTAKLLFTGEARAVFSNIDGAIDERLPTTHRGLGLTLAPFEAKVVLVKPKL